MNSLGLSVRGQQLHLLPERALFWQETQMLIFSDVHLGKAESLRAEGLNIPVESGASDFQRLEALIEDKSPLEIFILGDFIHHRKSWTLELMDELSNFLRRHQAISWNLILGNHERGSLPYLQELPLNLFGEDVTRGPFLLSHGHHQNETQGLLQISGHIHPVITLREGPLKMRCPCFVFSGGGLLLPSFGTWTGGAEITVQGQHRYFAIAGKEIFEVNIDRSDRSKKGISGTVVAGSAKNKTEDL